MGITIASVVSRIESSFRKTPEYQTRNFQPAHIYAWTDLALQHIYRVCYPHSEEFTVETVVSTEKYAMDGATGHLSAEIGEINRVDYDGAELSNRYLYPEQVTPKAATDEEGTPDGWAMANISEVRYLVLVANYVAIGAEAVVTVRVVGTRVPAAMAADPSGGCAIKLEADYLGVVLAFVKKEIFLDLQMFKAAEAWESIGEKLLLEMKWTVPGRTGRKVTRRGSWGPEDLLA